MAKYRFEEHGFYKKESTLVSFRPQFPIILSLVKKGSKVLDVGCGDGVLGQKLIQEKGCTVFGIDLDEVGVTEAKRKGISAKVYDADLGLPFKDRSFDLVICNELLEFTKKPDYIVSECLRVGKEAIIEFPNFGFWFYRFQMLLGRFPKLSLYGYNWWDTLQIKFFSLADFLNLPAMKNVKILKIICINWRNRKISFLAKLNPNLFSRSCILKIKA